MIGWIKNFFRRLLSGAPQANETHEPNQLDHLGFKLWRKANDISIRREPYDHNSFFAHDISSFEEGMQKLQDFAPTVPEWYERTSRKCEKE